MPVQEAPADEGPTAPRQTHNFAPGSYGLVYRAHATDDTPHDHEENEEQGERSSGGSSTHNDPYSESHAGRPAKTGDVTYKLHAMKWGLIPAWTKRNPAYGHLMKTINCRSDSLSQPGGMWASMKKKKRCIVVAQGFYEWLKTGHREKSPYHIKRKDGRLMYFAGLWDVARFEGRTSPPRSHDSGVQEGL